MPDRASETAALITLLRSGERPRQQYAELVEEAGSAAAVLGSDTLLTPDVSQAEADLAAWQEQGIQVVSVLDADYPENLRGVHDRPPLIFVRGAIAPEDSRSIAIVGTRKPSAAGENDARRVAKHLTAEGFTVVSGLARGIDTAAHRAALNDDGRTLAVIGTGVNRAYPAENADLQRQIARSGAVISQFWPDAPPRREHFPLRNAVMSGLTLGTVVVEASATSGTRIQARLALRHGRPVFLLPRLVEEQSWARELARLPGTHVVRSPAEVTRVVERLNAPDALVG
jgi:DNA processing protein